MDTPALPLALVLATLSVGCVSAALPHSTSFAFDLDGTPYVIISAGTAAEPANDLVRHDGPRVVLRGRDRDQDGVLDTVLVGSVPLAVADAVYRRGIEIAQARGAARARDLARSFELAEGSTRLVVWSVAEGGSGWANRFVRYGLRGQPGPEYTDSDADGRLDSPAPSDAQSAYERIVAAGLRADRLERVGARLRVRLGGG